MTSDQLDVRHTEAAVTNALRAHWKFFLVEGIVLLILGALAVCVPPLATVAVEVLIGWLILMSGVLGLVMTFQTRGSPGFGWSLLSAVVGTAAGRNRAVEGRRAVARVAAVGRFLADRNADDFPGSRGDSLNHVRARAPERENCTVGDDAGQRSGGLDSCGSHRRRAPWHGGLGNRSDCWNQFVVRRRGSDWTGAAGAQRLAKILM